MKIDRYMVNLFFEIRRNVPLALQEGMTISNPQLGDDMINLYQNTDDANIRILIEVFLERAGEEWPLRLKPKRSYYRGTQLGRLPGGRKKVKPKLIYRGQVIEQD